MILHGNLSEASTFEEATELAGIRETKDRRGGRGKYASTLH